MKLPTRPLSIALGALATTTLGGCYYGDVNSAGYAANGICSDRYYDYDPYAYDDGYGYDCYDASDYGSGFAQIGFGGGWYDNYYYPGYGMYLFDNYRNRYPLRGQYLNYWGGRRAWWRHHGGRDRVRGDGHWNGRPRGDRPHRDGEWNGRPRGDGSRGDGRRGGRRGADGNTGYTTTSPVTPPVNATGRPRGPRTGDGVRPGRIGRGDGDPAIRNPAVPNRGPGVGRRPDAPVTAAPARPSRGAGAVRTPPPVSRQPAPRPAAAATPRPRPTPSTRVSRSDRRNDVRED